MDCRLLSKDDFTRLYEAFKSAFSDYLVKLNPTVEEFEYRIENKLHMDYDISAGAFDGDSMVGFIVHAANVYEGIPTAYNGGTGVLPGFRNQKAAEELYSYLLPKIRQKFLARIILEVVENNEKAIKLYEKIGFTYRRRFLCYKQTKPVVNPPDHIIQAGKVKDIDFRFSDFVPSFIDSEEHLLLGNEHVLLCKIDGDTAGYLVYQPLAGRISQVAVSRLYRGEGVGKSLIYAVKQKVEKPLTVMNIPEDEIGFDAFLKECGFENQINQFEMELII